jgi:glucokinase
VYVDNDANVALLVEHRHGAARGARQAAMLTLGTGIGGGLLVDGRLYRGTRGFAAELGHMVIERDGGPCQGACPGRGHLELYASGSAIARAGREEAPAAPDSELGRRLAAGREVSGPLVTELAHQGDEAARAALRRVGSELGAGLVSIVNALDPEVVVIGGGAVAAGELLLEPARAVLAEQALPPLRERVRVVPAAFGDESGMLGAALLALDGGSV